MKPLMLLTLMGALAAPAAAGDLSIDFGFRHARHGNGISIAVGYRNGHRVERNRHRHNDHCQYVPGHYEVVQKQVWVPGGLRKEYRPARWGWRYDACGRRVRVLVRPAGYVMVQVPGHWDYVQERIWVAGYYACAHGNRRASTSRR